MSICAYDYLFYILNLTSVCTFRELRNTPLLDLLSFLGGSAIRSSGDNVCTLRFGHKEFCRQCVYLLSFGA